MPGILSSLRPAHALLLHFGKRRTLQGLVECFEPLQRYTQLTALHLDLSSAHGFKADRLTLRKAQDALDAALVAVACRNNNPAVISHAPLLDREQEGRAIGGRTASCVLVRQAACTCRLTSCC